MTPEPNVSPASVLSRFPEGGFVIVDKPRGPSSHQVTAWARDLLGVESAGHAGTLDPNVSGLLVVAFGPALRLLPLVLEFPKRYVGLVSLHGPVGDPALRRVLQEFQGPIFQTPPVRSAVKRQRRVRSVHRLELLERTPTQLLLDVTADSGTYIRTLAVDLGEALGVGANLTELRRIGTGPFKEADGLSLAQLSDELQHLSDEASGFSRAKVVRAPVEVWGEFPQVVLKDGAASAIVHGADLARGGILKLPQPFKEGARVVLVSRTGELLALGRALRDAKEIPHTKHGWVVDANRVLADPARFPPLWKSAREAAT